jgi:transglutaminase-like putative cysteine protease
MIQGIARIRWRCVLGLLILSVPAYADEWLPVSPEELQMTSEPKAPKAAAVYLYRQVDRNDNVPDETIYARIKVLSEEGRSFGNVEIPYDGDTESIRGLEARVIRPDGSVVNFNGTIYDKPLVKARGYEMMAKSFSLPNVEVGSIVEYRYRHVLAFGWVFNSRWLLSEDLFTRHAVFSLKPDRDFTLRWSWPLGLPEGTKPPVMEQGTIRLETRNVPAFVTEERMPPEDLMKFRVEFVYEGEESSQKDPAKYWMAFGKRMHRRLSNFVGDPDDLQEAVATIVQPADSPEVKVRKIYARIHQMRNLSFERQKTDQEIQREKLNEIETAKEAWKRGYGSGTDLTWLFLALVRAANVEAQALLVPTRDRYFFSKEQMNARQLNSNAVLVKLPDREVVVDPGTPFTPFGLLPWDETAVLSLSLDKDGGKWVTTPPPRPEGARVTRKLTAKLTTGGTLEGKLTVTYTGLEAASRRMRQRHRDAAERKEALEDDVQADVPTGIDVTLTNSPDWSGIETPLVAEFDFRAAGWASFAGKRVLVPVGIFGGGEKHMFEHGTRVHPLYFRFPNEFSDEVTIELPPGWKVSSVPKPRVVDISVAKYSMTTTPGVGSLSLKRELMLNMLLVQAKFYPSIQNFYQQIRAGDEEQAVVTQ